MHSFLFNCIVNYFFNLIGFFYLSRTVTEKPHQGSVNKLLYCIESFIIVLKPFSEPSGPPVNISARNLSSTGILVQWGEVPDTDKNGIILSYTVNYNVTPEGNIQQSQVVAAVDVADVVVLLKNDYNHIGDTH